MNTTNSSLPFPIPDGPVNYILSIIVVCGFSLFTAFNLVFVTIRRNHQPVKSRYVPAIYLSHFVFWFGIMTTFLRFIIGRNIFPCMFYTGVYCIVVPVAALPHVVRTWRLLIIFKLSTIKTSQNLQNSAKEKRFISVLSRLVSGKFFLSVLIVIMLIQTALWLLGSGLNSIKLPIYFTYTSGCGFDGISYIFLGLLAIYIAFDLLLMIFLIRGVRDTWGLRMETFTLTLIWTIFLVIFGVLFLVPAYADYYEYTALASGFVLVIPSVTDCFVSCTLQCILSFKKNVATANDQSELLLILSTASYREKFKQYAVESFCPESILCWEDIQQFKLLPTNEQKQDSLKSMVEKYCQSDSPVELNLPAGLGTYVKELKTNVEKADYVCAEDLLLPLENHCISDLQEVYLRFLNSAIGHKITKEQIEMKQQDEMLQKTGMAV